MARPKKQGKRAKGIQSKKGFLYIVTSQQIKDGEKELSKKIWTSTGLTDTPDNIAKASELRTQLLGKKSCTPILIDKNITLAEFADIFLDEKKRLIEESTYSTYENRSKNIVKHIGNVKLREINKKTVEEYLDNLFSVGKLQERTVRDLKVHLAGILDMAIEFGLISTNPAREATLNKRLASECAKVKATDDDFFSYEEAQRFLKLSKGHKMHKLFYVTLFFGLRRQEVLGLRWSAIDFYNKTMVINHTVTKVNKGVKRLNKGKTLKSIRQYHLTDKQVKMFQEIKRQEEENRKLFGKDYYDSEYVFKNEDGTLYYPDTLTDSFRDLIKSFPDLPQRIHFHGLRTSCVSIWVHANMDPKSIQEWVGHKDIETTLKIYTKVKKKEGNLTVSDRMDTMLPLDYE